MDEFIAKQASLLQYTGFPLLICSLFNSLPIRPANVKLIKVGSHREFCSRSEFWINTFKDPGTHTNTSIASIVLGAGMYEGPWALRNL